ncbi:MAG: hypothetical protein WC262_12560 [Bacteroidales bacterium]|jgi:hypothetical protein
MNLNEGKPFWEDSIYVSCECGCDVMRITKWEDEDPMASLCIFRSSHMGFWQRIKQAWIYLKHGEFYYNDMMITPEDARKMAEFLKSVPFREAK